MYYYIHPISFLITIMAPTEEGRRDAQQRIEQLRPRLEARVAVEVQQEYASRISVALDSAREALEFRNPSYPDDEVTITLAAQKQLDLAVAEAMGQSV